MKDPIIIPSDIERLQPWFDVLRQLNSSIAISTGTQWIEIGIFIDGDGKPAFWTRPERHTLNPKDREITITD